MQARFRGQAIGPERHLHRAACPSARVCGGSRNWCFVSGRTRRSSGESANRGCPSTKGPGSAVRASRFAPPMASSTRSSTVQTPQAWVGVGRPLLAGGALADAPDARGAGHGNPSASHRRHRRHHRTGAGTVRPRRTSRNPWHDRAPRGQRSPPSHATGSTRLAGLHGRRTQSRPRAAGDQLPFGSGWGHGVGLCQVGAYGMAMDGATVEEILKTYYRGIEVERVF